MCSTDIGDAACTASYTMLTVTWCHSECCVLSGLDIEATTWWFSCSYGLLSRALSGCKHDVDIPLFHPCLVDSKVLHPWALICERESLTAGLEYEWNSGHINTVAANSCNWHHSVLSSVTKCISRAVISLHKLYKHVWHCPPFYIQSEYCC